MKQSGTVKIAMLANEVTVLGPGKRLVIWFQGCGFACSGCIAPSFQSFDGGYEMNISQLMQWIQTQNNWDGVTISGGEPFAQIKPLLQLVKNLRDIYDQSIILYSGYTLETLIIKAKYSPEITDILHYIDVLIDGLYQHELNDSMGLRGSSNQQIHYLSKRHQKNTKQFIKNFRKWEVRERLDGKIMIGLPDYDTWKNVNITHNLKWYDTKNE